MPKPSAYLVVYLGHSLGYECAACNATLEQDYERPTLTHPTHTGWVRNRPSICPFAGKVFHVPTIGLEEKS